MNELTQLVEGLDRINILCDNVLVKLQGNRATVKRIPVHHDVPEHTEYCETMRIPTDYDFTNWNDALGAWQCQFCQRVYDTNTKQYVTEQEYKDSL